MGEEQPKQVESEAFTVATPSRAEEKTPNHDSYGKALVLVPPSKPTSLAEKAAYGDEKGPADPRDRDAAFALVEMDKRLALVKAWEESEKTKADNRAYKKFSAIGSWENTKRALVEAELKQIEEKYEKKKAEYAEKMKNKMALVHREAEEKRAMVEAKRGEVILKVEETAAKFRVTGNIPKKLFGCFN